MEIVLKSLVASGFFTFGEGHRFALHAGMLCTSCSAHSCVVHGYSIGIGLKALKVNLPLWAFFIGRKRSRRRLAANKLPAGRGMEYGI
jgi:hypothetical protein